MNLRFSEKAEFFSPAEHCQVLIILPKGCVYISEILLCSNLPVSWKFAHNRRPFLLRSLVGT
jgi:hypothetical protein